MSEYTTRARNDENKGIERSLLEYGNKPLMYGRYNQGVDSLVLCKFADVLDSGKILLGTTLITYLAKVFMIGRGKHLAESGRVTPPDNLRCTRH